MVCDVRIDLTRVEENSRAAKIDVVRG